MDEKIKAPEVETGPFWKKLDYYKFYLLKWSLLPTEQLLKKYRELFIEMHTDGMLKAEIIQMVCDIRDFTSYCHEHSDRCNHIHRDSNLECNLYEVLSLSMEMYLENTHEDSLWPREPTSCDYSSPRAQLYKMSF